MLETSPRKRTGLLELLTIALVVWSTGAVQCALLESDQTLWLALGKTLAWLGALLALRAVAARRFAGQTELPNVASWMLLALFVAPLLLEPLRQKMGFAAYSPEVILILCLRNMTIALAAWSAWPQARRQAALLSLCLVIFAVTLSREAAIIGVAIAFVLCGSFWLVVWHWSSLEIAHEIERTALPWKPIIVVLGGVALVFTAAFAGIKREASVRSGGFWGSGGNALFARHARGGVNDAGDAEVGAKKEAKSVGFADSDVFIESKQISLYDTISDMYGEPKVAKEQQRKIVVPFKEFIEMHKDPAESKDASEQFSVLRQPPGEHKETHSREAKALLYVEGRTPLHLRMTAYDFFDGLRWHKAPPYSGDGLEKQPNFWLSLENRLVSPLLSPSEDFTIKIGNLRTNRIPYSGHLSRFRIGRVDRADFYHWQEEGILAFDAPRLPPGTGIALQARHFNPYKVADYDFAMGHAEDNINYLSLPVSKNHHAEHCAIVRLAREWTKGQPRGWPQIEAIVGKLKNEYAHDRYYAAPDGCIDPVEHFLLHSKRGPSYLFASSTALLLRALGYPTRVVSGFYAGPQHYDAARRHTLVQEENTHFWSEVLLDRNSDFPYDRSWVTLESTPGYEVLSPQLTLLDRAMLWGNAVKTWVQNHVLHLLALNLLAIALYRCRLALYELAATFYWQRYARRSPQARVVAAMRLLEMRCRLAGCPRPHGTTPSRFFTGLATSETRRDMEQLCAMHDWVAYAPPHTKFPWPDAAVRGLCARLLKNCTRAALGA